MQDVLNPRLPIDQASEVCNGSPVGTTVPFVASARFQLNGKPDQAWDAPDVRSDRDSKVALAQPVSLGTRDNRRPADTSGDAQAVGARVHGGRET